MRFFFEKLSRRRRTAVATLGDKVPDFVTKNSTHWTSRIFFLQLFQVSRRITCAREATHATFAARWRRDNFQKIESPSQAKNRSCSRGLTSVKRGKTRATKTQLVLVLLLLGQESGVSFFKPIRVRSRIKANANYSWHSKMNAALIYSNLYCYAEL